MDPCDFQTVNDNSTLAITNHSKTFREHFRRNKSMWTILLGIVAVLIILAVTIPTTILMKNKKNTPEMIMTTTSSTTEEITTTTTAAAVEDTTTAAVEDTTTTAVEDTTTTAVEDTTTTAVEDTTTAAAAVEDTTTTTAAAEDTITTTAEPTTTTTSTRGLVLLTNTNETVYPVWDTIAGGNSKAATPGDFAGNYYYEEIPAYALDQNTATHYTNFGYCDWSLLLPICGTNTGFYLTLGRGAALFLAIQFVTASNIPVRDPITITVEGSNQTTSALTLGSSWTLIYNGSSGLDIDPGRSKNGITKNISNSVIWYNSYRLLVTSIRGDGSSAWYSEVRFLGY